MSEEIRYAFESDFEIQIPREVSMLTLNLLSIPFQTRLQRKWYYFATLQSFFSIEQVNFLLFYFIKMQKWCLVK